MKQVSKSLRVWFKIHFIVDFLVAIPLIFFTKWTLTLFGFPLENFDPLGRWRENYPQSKKSGSEIKIDASSELPSGESFANFDAFKSVLVNHRSEPFTHHLITQVLTYATGRHMEAADQFEIDEILARVQSEQLGMRTLVINCLTSEIFRSR